MENLVEKVNEKFLECTLGALDPERSLEALQRLISAYLDFARAAAIMQDMELDLEDWLWGDECCQL